MNYNEQIKKVRESLKLSQAEMAEKFGITQSYYSAMERGAKDIPASIIDKLINTLGVSSQWFYSSIGTIFKQNSKIGVLRKKAFESELSKEDQTLMIAMRELPELVEMLGKFLSNNIDIENIDHYSSIGAVWHVGKKTPIPYEHDKNTFTEAYEMNMNAYLHHLKKYSKSIIDFRSNIIDFLKKVKPLDQENEIKLPKE